MKTVVAGVVAGVVACGAGAMVRGEEATPAAGGAAAEAVRDWRYLLTIHEIARADDDARLAKLVGDNPDRTRNRDAAERTPAHVAAEVGALKSLRVLGKAGADLNAADKKGRTPLTIAVGLNYATTVKTLLELGADVSQAGVAEGAGTETVARTPVAIAARRGYADVMKVLLDAKPNLSSPDADGATPLTSAAENKKWSTMKLLLDHGADANVKDASGHAAIHYAIAAGNIDAVKMVLAAKGDANSAAGNRTALTMAVAERNIEIVRALLGSKADANLAVEKTTVASPMLLAASRGDAKMVAVLLENKADPNAKDTSGTSAVIFAVRSKSLETLQALLAAGANPNVIAGDGAMALAEAVEARDVSLARALLEAKANPNLRPENGATLPLLFQMVERGEEPMAELLLRFGANPNAAGTQGRMPIAVTERPTLWRLLADKGANVNVLVGDQTRLQRLIHAGNVENLKTWLAFNPDPLLPDREGRTAKELAREYAERPTGTYEGDAARKEMAVVLTEYQKKAWEEREKRRRK